MHVSLKKKNRPLTSGNRLRIALISYDFGEYCVRLASALAQHAEVLLVIPERIVGAHISKLNDAVQLLSFPIRDFASRSSNLGPFERYSRKSTDSHQT